MEHRRKIIHTDQAPKAIGTYSQAVRVGDTVYLSGQIPLDPVTMQLVDGDIEQEIRRVFENLKAVVAAAGGTLAQAVKVNVFLTDLANFAKVNEIMAKYFTEPYPARAAVAWRSCPGSARRDRVHALPWAEAPLNVATPTPPVAPSSGPITAMRGVGPALAEQLGKLGVTQVQDLLFVLPLRYEDRTQISEIGSVRLACASWWKAKYSSPK